MANIVDPDHLATSDLDLHCLLRPVCLKHKVNKIIQPNYGIYLKY